jgi:hypothetical protein
MQKHQNCCRIAVASEILYNCIKTVIALKLHLQLHWRLIALLNYRIKYTKYSHSTYLPSMWLLKTNSVQTQTALIAHVNSALQVNVLKRCVTI